MSTEKYSSALQIELVLQNFQWLENFFSNFCDEGGSESSGNIQFLTY